MLLYEYEGFQKSVMANVDVETEVDINSVRDAWEFAESLPVPNPVKEVQEVTDGLWTFIITSLLKDLGAAKAHSRICTDTVKKQVMLRLTLEEWNTLLKGYLTSIKENADSLSEALKGLAKEYAVTASMSRMAGGIAERLGVVDIKTEKAEKRKAK